MTSYSSPVPHLAYMLATPQRHLGHPLARASDHAPPFECSSDKRKGLVRKVSLVAAALSRANYRAHLSL
eukprot:6213638-Pleurochrysis_carterae.AAC.3